MYVCHGFMVEIYRFRHSLRTCLARAAHDSRTWRIEDDARMSPDVWKTVNCSTQG